MVSREELYRLVWAQPMIKVAAQLDTSGSYLARVCTALRVPRPERGYWAKLQVGKAPPMPPLPESRVGDLQEWVRNVALPPTAPTKVASVVRPEKQARRSPLGETHELIGGARKIFESGRKIKEGDYLRPYKGLVVDITVSEGQLLRALDVANTLFNALEVKGHRVALAHRGQSLWRIDLDENEVPKKRVGHHHHRSLWSPNVPTVVYIGEVPVGLALVELSEAVLTRYVNGKYVREAEYLTTKAKAFQRDYTWTSMQNLRSGRLRLVAYAPRYQASCSMQWQEAKGKTLLEQISAIVAAMPAFASEVAAKVHEAELAWERSKQEYEEAEERRRRKADREKIQASHDESVEHLEKIIADWARALEVERFFVGIEVGAALLPEDNARLILNRLALAREFIGSVDPMKFFLAWRTPLERYQPIYEDDATPASATGNA